MQHFYNLHQNIQDYISYWHNAECDEMDKQIEAKVDVDNDVKTMLSISDIQKKNIPIDKAYLVSCVNSRVSDLAEAAKIV